MKSFSKIILFIFLGSSFAVLSYTMFSNSNKQAESEQAINSQSDVIEQEILDREPGSAKELPSSAKSIKEGNCLKSPMLPDIVLKIHKVGDSSISIQSNLTGSLLTQYDKQKLEEEIKIGTTEFTSCDEFKAKDPSGNSQSTPILDLFGVKLDDSYDKVQSKHAGDLISCVDEKYRTHDYQLNTYSEADIPLKKCHLKEDIEITFYESEKPGVFEIATFEKDFKDTEVTLGLVLKKLEQKTGSPVNEAVPYGRIYNFSRGFISVEFFSGDYKKNNESKLKSLRWWKKPTLDEKVLQKSSELDLIKKKTLERENEKKAKNFNL